MDEIERSQSDCRSVDVVEQSQLPIHVYSIVYTPTSIALYW